MTKFTLLNPKTIINITSVTPLINPYQNNIDIFGFSSELPINNFDYKKLLSQEYSEKNLELRIKILSELTDLQSANREFKENPPIEQYENREKIYETLAELYDELGEKKAAQGYRDLADEDFAQIILKEPELFWKRREEARGTILQFEKSADAKPNKVEKVEIKKRIRKLDQVIRECPDAEWAYYDRAQNKIYLGQDEDALKDLNLEIENNLDPLAQSRSKYERGLIYYKMGDFYKAGLDLKEVVDIGEKDKSDFAKHKFSNIVNEYLEKIRQKIEKNEDFMVDFNELSELDADSEILNEKYLSIKIEYISRNKKEEALKFFEKISSVYEVGNKNILKIINSIKRELSVANVFKPLSDLAAKHDFLEEYNDLIGVVQKINYYQDFLDSGHRIYLAGSNSIREALNDFWSSSKKVRNSKMADILNLIDNDTKNDRGFEWQNNLNKGLIYIDSNQFYEAQEIFKKLLVYGKFYVGLIELSQGNCANAVSSFTDQIDIFEKPNESNDKVEYSYYLRGIANTKLGKYEEAIKDFSQKISIDQDVNAYKWRGFLNKVLGHEKKADDDFYYVEKHNSATTSRYKIIVGIVSGYFITMLAVAIVNNLNEGKNSDKLKELTEKEKEQIERFAKYMVGVESFLEAELTEDEKEAMSFIDHKKILVFFEKIIQEGRGNPKSEFFNYLNSSNEQFYKVISEVVYDDKLLKLSELPDLKEKITKIIKETILDSSNNIFFQMQNTSGKVQFKRELIELDPKKWHNNDYLLGLCLETIRDTYNKKALETFIDLINEAAEKSLMNSEDKTPNSSTAQQSAETLSINMEGLSRNNLN